MSDLLHTLVYLGNLFHLSPAGSLLLLLISEQDDSAVCHDLFLVPCTGMRKFCTGIETP